jgi:signal transduction histidine kinase
MNGTPDDPEIDFYDAVVYQLRQPLTSINGGVQLARRLLKTDPSGADEALDHVVGQIARLNLMIVELRDRAHDAAHAEAVLEE